MHNPYESPQVDPYMHDPQETAVPDIVFIEEPRERLSWLHGQLWLVAMAVLVYFTPGLLNYLIPYPLDLYFARNFYWTWLNSMGLAGLFLAALRLWTKVDTFPKTFGHWLLVFVGCDWIVQRLIDVWVQKIRYATAVNPGRDLIDDPVAWIPQIEGLPHLMAVICVGYVIWRTRPDKLWLRYAYCRLAIGSWFLIVSFGGFSNVSLLLVMTVVLTVPLILSFAMAVLRDLLGRTEHDLFHWLGIVAEGCSILPMVLLYNGQLAQAWLAPPPLGY
ncbi:hypothetical protein NA78x_001037 [Anatilimnocola sp. NA78]|uniref:hypothetical protein n=1 Tax=Anatilimnocola sp. NA78 TaxID=3415683 RepID=UPI003CE554D5